MIEKAKIAGIVFGTLFSAVTTLANSSVKIAWDPSSGTVSGYKVYCSPTASSAGVSAAVGNTTSAVIGNLTPGQNYTFYVTSYDSTGAESVPSNQVSYNVPASSNPSSFSFSETNLRGNWHGTFGSEGSWIVGASPNIPSSIQIQTTAPQWIWEQTTSSPYAPFATATGTNRIASCWYSSSQIEFTISVTDGQMHQMAMYFLDWTRSGRQQEIELIDQPTGSVLDSQVLTNFSQGVYLGWNITGSVTIRVTPIKGNAVVSGLFLDSAQSVAIGQTTPGVFKNTDTNLHGNWQGNFGSQGYWIAGLSPALPPSATVSTAAQQWIWEQTTTSTYAPYSAASGPSRIASCWYSSNPMEFAISIKDGQAHQIAMYFLDWTKSGRIETVELVDAVTGGVLDSRNLSNFGGGIYLIWTVSDDVVIRVTPSNVNAVVSGIFVD